MADVVAGNSSADANGNEVSDVNAVSAGAGMPTNYIVRMYLYCTQFHRGVVDTSTYVLSVVRISKYIWGNAMQHW